jgi:hypothetical protein
MGRVFKFMFGLCLVCVRGMAATSACLLTYSQVCEKLNGSSPDSNVLLVLLDGLDEDQLPKTIVMKHRRQTNLGLRNSGIMAYWTMPTRPWKVSHVEECFHPFGWIELPRVQDAKKKSKENKKAIKNRSAFAAFIISKTAPSGYGTTYMYRHMLALASNAMPHLGVTTRENLNGVIGQTIKAHYARAYLTEKKEPQLTSSSLSPALALLEPPSETA